MPSAAALESESPKGGGDFQMTFRLQLFRGWVVRAPTGNIRSPAGHALFQKEGSSFLSGDHSHPGPYLQGSGRRHHFKNPQKDK